MVRVSKVRPGSIAEELEITPGTELLSVNGRELRDFLDWEFLGADEELGRDGAVRLAGGNEAYDLDLARGQATRRLDLRAGPLLDSRRVGCRAKGREGSVSGTELQDQKVATIEDGMAMAAMSVLRTLPRKIRTTNAANSAPTTKCSLTDDTPF